VKVRWQGRHAKRWRPTPSRPWRLVAGRSHEAQCGLRRRPYQPQTTSRTVVAEVEPPEHRPRGDQHADLGRKVGAAEPRPRLPAPEAAPPLAVPPHDGIRADEHQMAAPRCGEPMGEHPEERVPWLQPRSPPGSQGDGELLSEHEVLKEESALAVACRTHRTEDQPEQFQRTWRSPIGAGTSAQLLAVPQPGQARRKRPCARSRTAHRP
jgi:hypothetical protein